MPTHSQPGSSSSHLALKAKAGTSKQGCNSGGTSDIYRQIASSSTQVTMLKLRRILRPL